MPRSRHSRTPVPAFFARRIRRRLKPSSAAPLASLALLAVAASTAGAQAASATDTPLHLAASRFEFTASGEAPRTQPLRVHNGGTTRFTDVRLTGVTYADSARGAAWLVSQPRQSAVAPDELATVGMLCVDATGLAAGTYRATAAVAAREVPQPVPFTITLVVTDAGAHGRPAARCDTAPTK